MLGKGDHFPYESVNWYHIHIGFKPSKRIKPPVLPKPFCDTSIKIDQLYKPVENCRKS